MPGNDAGDHAETRQERRDRKLKSQHERIAKHGKNLGKIYQDAVKKRLKKK